MPAVVNHLVLLFADDSKLIAPIQSPSDLISLQNDLDALEEWSGKWHMLFNVEKCKIMEFSKSGKSIYANADFFMGKPGARSALKFVETEKDLGVTFSRNLKFSAHVKTQANRASAILGEADI